MARAPEGSAGKRPVVVTCALTGGGDTVGKNPAVPVTPEEIATSAVDAAKAGAAVVHIHVRDPATGKPSTRLELYREVADRIRAVDADVVLNITTGAGARFIPSEKDPKVGGEGSTLAPPEFRVKHIEAIRPEICTLDITTMNFGEFVFVNTPAHLRVMGKAVATAGVLPELECFDSGNVRLALRLIEEGVLKTPAMFQICLGVPWGAPATPEAMMFMKNMLPAGTFWTGFGIGPAQFPMVAQALLLGGHVRVGLEDNLHLERGVLAPSNAALVEKAVRIVRALDAEPATPAEARRLLGLPRPPA